MNTRIKSDTDRPGELKLCYPLVYLKKTSLNNSIGRYEYLWYYPKWIGLFTKNILT